MKILVLPLVLLTMLLQGCDRNKCLYLYTNDPPQQVELAKEYIGKEDCYDIGKLYKTKTELYITSVNGVKYHQLQKKNFTGCDKPYCTIIPPGSLFRFKGVYYSSNEVFGTLTIGLMSMCDEDGNDIIPWCEISMDPLCKKLADYTINHGLFEAMP